MEKEKRKRNRDGAAIVADQTNTEVDGRNIGRGKEARETWRHRETRGSKVQAIYVCKKTDKADCGKKGIKAADDRGMVITLLHDLAEIYL